MVRKVWRSTQAEAVSSYYAEPVPLKRQLKPLQILLVNGSEGPSKPTEQSSHIVDGRNQNEPKPPKNII